MSEAPDADAPFRDLELSTIGLVVPDVVASARAYARLLGVRAWRLRDLPLRDVESDAGASFDPEAIVRVGAARVGRLDLELLQPLGGRDSHRAFLERHGGGIHHVGFAPVTDREERVELVRRLGIGVEMEAVVAGGTGFTYLDTQDLLCTRLRLRDAAGPGASNGPAPWAEHEFDGTGGADLGRRDIVQLGIVVADAERAADGYSRLLGVDDWSFVEFQPPDGWRGVFHDVPMSGPRFRIKGALAWHGAMQIELLQPTAGTSTHMDFLRRHGSGIHHVSFGPLPEHDEALAALQKAGVVVEMGGQLGGGAWFTYLQTQRTLGTIFEMVRAGA